MGKFANQEAFVLAAKRVKARITRANELKIDTLDDKGILKLVENLATAKAISTDQHIDKVRRGQEYYVQTLVDSLAVPVNDLVQIEYDHATMELGSESEILTSLESLQGA